MKTFVELVGGVLFLLGLVVGFMGVTSNSLYLLGLGAAMFGLGYFLSQRTGVFR